MVKDSVRPYESDRHLWFTVTDDAGTLGVHPITETRIYFDAAKGNHMPAMKDTGEHGSTILACAGLARVRVSGTARLGPSGWDVDRSDLYADADDGNITPRRFELIRVQVRRMVEQWACSHPDELADADRIYRNNAAHSLEEKLARLLADVETVRENIAAADNGGDYGQYPKLQTDGRG